MKKFTSKTQKRGKIGEDVACKFLSLRKFCIVERNLTRKWGEIDIIATKGDVVHFVEVKSVSRENSIRPEENMHFHKQERLMRMIETFVSEWSVTAWQFDVLCVYMDMSKRRARVTPFWDVILGK